MLRLHGDLMPIKFRELGDTELEGYVNEILNDHQRDRFRRKQDVDFSYVSTDGGRFRVNVFHKVTGVGVALGSGVGTGVSVAASGATCGTAESLQPSVAPSNATTAIHMMLFELLIVIYLPELSTALSNCAISACRASIRRRMASMTSTPAKLIPSSVRRLMRRSSASSSSVRGASTRPMRRYRRTVRDDSPVCSAATVTDRYVVLRCSRFAINPQPPRS